MNQRDIFVLIGSKLKIRKLRTAVTVITASILYSIVITVLITTCGLYSGMANSADTNLGKPLLVINYPTPDLDTPEIREEAIRLYNESTDPDKKHPIHIAEELNDDGTTTISNEWPPMLTQGNPFALAAIADREAQLNQEAKTKIAELSSPHGGKIVSPLKTYQIKRDHEISISGLEQDVGPAILVTSIDNKIIANLIKFTEQKDDVIQVLPTLNQAAKLLNIRIPRWSTPNSTEALRDFIRTVNQRAIGHQFTGTLTNLDQSTTEITYQIVGILPPKPFGTENTPLSTIKNNYENHNLNPLETIVHNIQSDTFSSEYDFLVTNPDSIAFKNTYDYIIQNGFHATPAVVAFDDVKAAAAFKKDTDNMCIDIGKRSCYPIRISELASNHLEIQASADFVNITINAAAIIFTIVAAIIMTGTVSRVVSDERQTIALYRAVGASTKNILQVFCAYILTLCLLIITCATIIGIILSGIITAANTSIITANVAALHNVPDLAPIVFIGFDLRLLLVYTVIIAIGILCLLQVIGKLVSKNIIKDLRKV